MNTRRQFLALSAATVSAATFGMGSGSAQLADSDLEIQNASFIVSGDAATPVASPEPAELRGYILGDPTAPNTLRIFADYRCPHCRMFAAEIEPQLIEDYVSAGMMNIEYLDFTVIGVPSFDALGDDSIESVQAAEAAACAAEQDSYLVYRDWLFEGELRTNDGDFSDENLIGAAEEFGLDADQFSESLSSGKYEQGIIDSVTLGLDLGVQGTPTMILNNGEPFFVPENGYDGLKELIDSQIG